MLANQERLQRETQAKQQFSQKADLRARELSMVNNISIAISNLQSLDSILRLIFEQISRYVHLDIFFIALLDEKTGQVAFPVMYDGGQFWDEPPRMLPNAISVAKAIETGQAFLWNRTPKEMEEARNSSNRVGDPNRIAASIIVIPLQTAQRRIGALSVQSYEMQAYTSEHLSILAALAQQVTVAIENARLFEQTNLRARRLQTLNEIGRDLATLRDLPALMKVIFEQIKQILPSDLFYLGLYDAAKNEMSFPLMYDDGRIWEESARKVTETSFSHRAIQTRKPFLVNDWVGTQTSASPPRVIVGDQTKTTASLIMSPIMFRDQVIGVISTQSYQPNAFTEEDLDLLSGIANQVGIAIENTNLLDETRKNAQRLAILNNVSRAIAELKSLPEIFEIVYELTKKSLRPDAFFVGMHVPETNQITFPITYDDNQRYETVTLPVLDDSFLARFLRGEPPILMNRTKAEMDALTQGEIIRLGNQEKTSASFIVAPLTVGRRVVGLISVQSYTPDTYAPTDLDLLVRIANQVSIAVENSRLYTAAQQELAERQRIAEQLQAAETKYRDLIEHSPAVIYSSETGADGRWFYVSPQIETLLGFTPEEWMAQPDLWYELIHPEDRGRTLEAEQLALQANSKIDMDYRMHTRDGRLVWIHDESLNVSISNNKQYIVQGILTDITLRKTAEIHLRESEERYHLLFLTAGRQTRELSLLSEIQNSLSRELELAELLRTVVQAVAKAFGYYFVSLYILKDGLLELQHQVGYDPNNEIRQIKLNEGVMGQVMHTGQAIFIPDVSQDPNFLRADPRIWSEISIPLFNGDEICGILNVESSRAYQLSQDDLRLLLLVSEQVNIAIRRASLYNERAETIRREQHINEFAHAISSTLELSNILQKVAELSVRLINADTATVSLMSEDGQTQTDVYNYNEEPELNITLPKGSGLTWLAYESGKPVIVDEYAKHPNALPEWSISGLHAFMAFPIILGEKKLGSLALFNRNPTRKFSQRDFQLIEAIAGETAVAIQNARLFEALQKELDERRRVEREREAMYHDLEAKNAELERFTYTVSHDLKSPLVTIAGFLGFLEDDIRKGESERIRRTILRIHEAALKMHRLLDELLELSRVGRLANPSAEVSLSELAEEAVELTQGQLVARQVEVQVEAGLPVVFVDRVRMVEVLQNLIVNATKFMGGQAHPLIEIGAQTIHGQTTFFVRDNGVGIAPEYHKKVFGLFDKLDPGSEGTGIGLALVKRIVEVHGGTIWIESELGKGATFFFTLGEKNQ
jgi:PAS domain S-box-containing protein